MLPRPGSLITALGLTNPTITLQCIAARWIDSMYAMLVALPPCSHDFHAVIVAGATYWPLALTRFRPGSVARIPYCVTSAVPLLLRQKPGVWPSLGSEG